MSERTFLDGLIGFVGPQGPAGPQGPPGPSGGGGTYARATAQLAYAHSEDIEVTSTDGLEALPSFGYDGNTYFAFGPGVDDGFFALLENDVFGLQYVSTVPGDVWVLVTTTVTLLGSNAGDAYVYLGLNMQGAEPQDAQVVPTYVPQVNGAYVTVTWQRLIYCNNTSASKLVLCGMRSSYGSVPIEKVLMTCEVKGPYAAP